MLKHVLLVCVLMSPVAAWALYKPVRVLAPHLVPGVSCVNGDICLEDVSRYTEAEKLYDDALRYVNNAIDPLENNPRITFCSSSNCFRSFGFDHAAAVTVGVSGIVVSPRGWNDYYLRHELIHHLQAERLGVLGQLLSPKWFKEGMAYSFSLDDRRDLTEPWNGYRLKFEEWYRSVGKVAFWEEAGAL